MKNKFKELYKIVNYVRKSLNTEIVMCKEEDYTITSEKIKSLTYGHIISFPFQELNKMPDENGGHLQKEDYLQHVERTCRCCSSTVSKEILSQLI